MSPTYRSRVAASGSSSGCDFSRDRGLSSTCASSSSASSCGDSASPPVAQQRLSTGAPSCDSSSLLLSSAVDCACRYALSNSLCPPDGPQSIGQVLDAGFRIFKVSLVRCLLFGAIAMIAGQLPNISSLAVGQRFDSYLQASRSQSLLAARGQRDYGLSEHGDAAASAGDRTGAPTLDARRTGVRGAPLAAACWG